MADLFPLGEIVLTTNAHRFLSKQGTPAWEASKLIARHASGDWGEVTEDDAMQNDEAVHTRAQILSAYTVNGQEVWVMTEGDRSVTTVLLPEDH